MKRYTVTTDYEENSDGEACGFGAMEESEDGDWVKWLDAKEWKSRQQDTANQLSEALTALNEGAEFLHAFTPAGIPAVDAFIAKWSDRATVNPRVES